MHFDDILPILGEFGRYQKFQLFLICLTSIPISYFLQANTFMSASSDHYCKVYDNQTFHDTSPLKNCTIPYDADGETWDSCSRYDVNVSMGISPELCSQDSGTQDCDNGWVYDRSVYENTVVHEFNLVCNNDWMKQFSKSVVPFGNLFGGIIFGQLSDIFGRKPLFVITLISAAVFGVLAAFSPTYAAFVVCQFVLGVVSISTGLIGFVIVVELVGPSYRLTCSILTSFFLPIGEFLLAFSAIVFNGHWRKIQLFGGVISIIFIPYYWWLMQRGNYGKAEKILRRAAQMNKVTLPNDIFDEEKEMLVSQDKIEKEIEDQNKTMLDLFKTPTLRKRTIYMCFNWFAVSLVYYGLALNTDQLGTNPYTTYVISGVVELPSYLLCWYLLDKIGRRWTMCSCMVFGGIALILSAIPDNNVISSAFAMVGKFFISGAFLIVYIFAVEIYPTPVRNAGLGLSSTCARIGSIISPYVILLTRIWHPTPFLIMAITSIIAGLLALLLPETRNKDLPETLEEGELFGMKRYKNCTDENEEEDTESFEMQSQCDVGENRLDEDTDKQRNEYREGLINDSFMDN
uniref:Organic cation transporter protein-like n=1 Tax=Saccoglossus kowalevskii TaxID=10224 RepID=A0ABM0N0K3_SACKO|nr:PREDICTED: organic cation transporter protein-like [Saccoglossus kowalevskii]